MVQTRPIFVRILWVGIAFSLLLTVFSSLFLLPSNRINSGVELEYVGWLLGLGLASNLIWRDIWIIYFSVLGFIIASIIVLPVFLNIVLTLFYSIIWCGFIYAIQLTRAKM